MNSRCAFLFPGQGAQAQGMAVDIVEAFPEARRVFEQGREILGFDVFSICRDGPVDELNSTRVSQPSIFLHSMVTLELMGRRLGAPAPFGTGLPAAVTAGLSLGEYSALVFAGALEFEAALRLVGKRGEYMQEACNARKGAMASILGLPAGRVEEVIGEARAAGLEVGVANYNSPGQTVISGEEGAVAEAVERLRAAGARRAVPLRVAGAYHSPLMAGATKRLEPLLREVSIKKPRLPFIANYLGAEVREPDEIREGLVRQVESPVRWEETVRAVGAMGVTSCLEVGPGRVLQGLVRNTDRSLAVESVGGCEALDNLRGLPV